jgi:hypothetical protein
MQRGIWIIRAMLIAASLMTASSAFAGGKELVDQGDNYINDGQQWPVLGALEPLVGSIPFALNFGSGAVSGRTFFLDPHGRLDFTTDISGTTNTGDFVNILFNTTPSTNGQFTPRLNITNDVGLLDPSVIDSTLASHFDNKALGLDAYRFWFTGVCPTNDASCSGLDFQAVFVHLTDNAFVLEFNYGTNFFDSLDPTSEFLAGFQIGSNTASFNNGFSGTGPDFCFNNGVASNFTTIANCVGTTSTTVPEPDVRSLVLLGGLLLAACGVLRRRQPTQRAAI